MARPDRGVLIDQGNPDQQWPLGGCRLSQVEYADVDLRLSIFDEPWSIVVDFESCIDKL